MLISLVACVSIRSGNLTHPRKPPSFLLQIGSPFNLRQHFNLHALLQQEDRVGSLQTLRDDLLNFRESFEIFGHYDSFEESFFARDPDCRSVPSITTFDLYVSTVLPLDHKQIRSV